MTDNFEAAELRAQLDECQRIIAAQAETIAAAHKDVAILKSHNDMMTLRAKKAEDGLAEFRADVMARETRGLAVSIPESLNDDLIAILGRPNFQCAGIATILRHGGREIACKSEHEQAATIHFLLKHYLSHGASWAEKVSEDLKAMASAPQQGIRQ